MTIFKSHRNSRLIHQFRHLIFFYSHSQDAFVPINVTNGIDTYDDFFNLLDEESRKQLAVISRK